MSAYRGELTGARRWLVWFTIPSIAGGAFGAWLLLHTSGHRFGAIVPFFMLGATVPSSGSARLHGGCRQDGSSLEAPDSWTRRGVHGAGWRWPHGLRFHDLRHTVITMRAEMGVADRARRREEFATRIALGAPILFVLKERFVNRGEPGFRRLVFARPLPAP